MDSSGLHCFDSLLLLWVFFKVNKYVCTLYIKYNTQSKILYSILTMMLICEHTKDTEMQKNKIVGLIHTREKQNQKEDN